MKFITTKKFNNLKVIKEHCNILILNDTTLLKAIKGEEISFIKELMKFKIDKLGLPDEIYKVVFANMYLYSMPYFKDFKSLYYYKDYEKNFSDKEILNFFKNLLEKTYEMHQNGLASGDMWSSNILMNSNLDYRFVDFDYATTDNFLGHMINCGPIFLDNYDNTVLNSNYSIKGQVELSDKMSILNMVLNCMATGNFSCERDIEIPSNFEIFNFPETLDKKFRLKFEEKELVRAEDYFLEEIDTLIKKDYKLPYRKKK